MGNLVSSSAPIHPFLYSRNTPARLALDIGKLERGRSADRQGLDLDTRGSTGRETSPGARPGDQRPRILTSIVRFDTIR